MKDQNLQSPKNLNRSRRRTHARAVRATAVLPGCVDRPALLAPDAIGPGVAVFSDADPGQPELHVILPVASALDPSFNDDGTPGTSF